MIPITYHEAAETELLNEKRIMTCELCGAQAAASKKTTKSFGRGDNLVIIENIPIIHCSSCHESYLTADTARELDRIRKNRRSLGKAKRVLVASFKKSAA